MTEPATLTIGAKRTMEYAVSCLSLFNRGAGTVGIVSVGDCISKAAEVVRIVTNDFGAHVSGAKVSQVQKGGSSFTRSDFHLQNGTSGFSPDSALPGARESGFVSFPVYHLLFDDILHAEGELTIEAEREKGARQDLLRITPKATGFQCRASEGLEATLAQPAYQEEGRRRPTYAESTASALYRSGYILSKRWEEIGGRLGEYDDVVLGLDTNILYNCVITQQLLDSLVLSCAPSASPNWVLLVVPSTVMHEIEQAANSPDDRGGLSMIGRIGYRALQEILELDQGRDLRGVSLLIVGETDPVLETRIELRGLREDFKRTAPKDIQGTLSRKASVGDTLIRDQFKAFLRQLGFHKGTFFLTADKSNSALGQAEGLHALYFPTVDGRHTIHVGEMLVPPEVSFDEGKLVLDVPLGKLIYELAVQFGTLHVSWSGDAVRVECDSRGDSLEHWLNRELRIADHDLARMVAKYKRTPKVSLNRADELWGQGVTSW